MTKPDKRKRTNQYWVQHWRWYIGLKKGYTNPIQHTSPSMFVFDAMEQLGTNQWHSIKDICKQTKELMSKENSHEELTVWDAFYTRPRKIHSADESLKNIIQRYGLTYGIRLQAMRCRIEQKKKNGTVYLYLNTHAKTGPKELTVLEPKIPVTKSFLRKLLTSLRTFISTIRW